MKRYLATLIDACMVPTAEDQDALEYAVIKGWVALAYDLDVDRLRLLGQMDRIRAAYKQERNTPVDEDEDQQEAA